MPKLSDLSLSLLLQEIAAAMQAEIPIVDAMKRLQTNRLGGVGRAAGRIATHLENGQTLQAAITASLRGIGSAIPAAVASTQRTADATLLWRTSRLLRRRHELRRIARFVWLYPVILLVVGYLIGALVMAPTIRDHTDRDLFWPAEVTAVAEWLEFNWPYPLIGFAVIVVVFFLRSRRSDRMSRAARYSLFCHALADQIHAGVEEVTAIRTAAEMAQLKDLQQQESPTLNSRSVQEVMSVLHRSALEPIPRSEASIPTAKQSGEQATWIEMLRYAAECYGEADRRRTWIMSSFLPRAAVLVLGGGMILTYVVAVIAPVYLQVGQW